MFFVVKKCCIYAALGVSQTPREYKKERGEAKVVELDQLKSIYNAYEEPLAEMRDSL